MYIIYFYDSYACPIAQIKFHIIIVWRFPIMAISSPFILLMN